MPETPPAPPKPRRRKAKRPAADPATPRKPRTTLLSRIEAMGPTHVEAYRSLCRALPSFETDMRDALAVGEEAARANDRLVKAIREMEAAEQAKTAADAKGVKSQAVIRHLDALARSLADAHGAIPTDDAHAAPVAPEPDAD